jgi:IS30 family transposase
MDRSYRQLTMEERRMIFRLRNAKLSIRAIAIQLGRHCSTIYREIRRNEFRAVKEFSRLLSCHRSRVCCSSATTSAQACA